MPGLGDARARMHELLFTPLIVLSIPLAVAVAAPALKWTCPTELCGFGVAAVALCSKVSTALSLSALPHRTRTSDCWPNGGDCGPKFSAQFVLMPALLGMEKSVGKQFDDLLFCDNKDERAFGEIAAKIS